MRAIDLKSMIASNGLDWTTRHIAQALESKELDAFDFSIRDMMTHLVPDGAEYVRLLNPRARSGGTSRQVFEAAHVVDTGAFSRITGQLMFSTFLEHVQAEEFITQHLFTDMPSKIHGREILPGTSRAKDEFETPVAEGHDYPTLGLSEVFVDIPKATKHGGIIPITREMVDQDNFNMLIEAQSIAEALGKHIEKVRMDVFIGATNSYRRNDVARDTYDTAAAPSNFNNLATEVLTDETDINVVHAIFRAMRDPSTGEPFSISPKVLVCHPDLLWTARRIVKTTEVRYGAAGAGVPVSIAGNSIPWPLAVYSNEYVETRLTAGDGKGGLDTDTLKANKFWFLGDALRTFVWKIIYPLTVTQQGTPSESEFNQDIVLKFKAMYKAVPGVKEPRLMVRSNGTVAS